MAEWHEPLVRRPGLTTRAILGLARFVATPLQSVLRGRPNVDPGTAAELDRIAETRPGKSRADDVTAPSGSDTSRRSGSAQSLESPEVRAKRLFTDGKLTDDAVQTALQLGDYEMVTAALSLRARIPLDIVERILDMENARAVTALCWKGGYKMRFALEVQKRIARIPSGRLLYARDGYDYPLPQSEMEYQLALFGE